MTYNVGSPEWVAERRSYLGASEMAAALGLSPWDDPISVWERKIGEAPEKPESFRMKLGTLIEPLIGKLASEQLGAPLHRMAGPKRHPAARYLASNPDFRIVKQLEGRTGRGLVQAKLRLDEPFGEADDGEGRGIPLHYRLQGLGELMTTGYDYVYFAAMNPREGVRMYPLDRRLGDNEEAISDLFEDAKEWWNLYVIPKRVPPPSAESAEALRRRYPEAKLAVGKIASAEQEAVLHDYLQLRDSAKALDHEVDDRKATIKSWIADAKYLEGAGKRFTWSRFDVTKVEWEPIATAYRAMLDGILQRAGVDEIRFDTHPDTGSAMVASRETIDAIEQLYTRTERSDRLTVGEIK